MRGWQQTLYRSLCLLVFLLPLLVYANTNATLKKITVHSASPTHTQLILNLTAPATYNWFVLQNPTRIVIDFQQVGNVASLSNLPLANTLVQKVRSGQRPQGGLRLVFELAQPASISINILPSTTQYAERLVLNINAKVSTAPAQIATKQPTTAQTVSAQPTAHSQQQFALTTPVTTTPDVSYTTTLKPVISLPSHVPPSKLVVVIDPGHGGKDPGASGPNGIQEKNVVLAISRDLYKLLANQPGVTVYMTRYGDYYLGLRQRLQIARRDKADVFIAIHADAYKDAYSTGASVFALSVSGASSEAARWLAEKENYSELAGVNLNGKNDTLRSVLIDLSQTATISSSLWLGGDLLQQIGQISPLHKDKVEQARFVVLKSPDIPSVLIETGFISNSAEERALSNAAYQQKMALAIESGISKYFKQHPPVNG
ncbi:MAG: N-acetylmuramoyl-L-alanine amidase [Gammaproteobacteria bacterium]